MLFHANSVLYGFAFYLIHTLELNGINWNLGLSHVEYLKIGAELLREGWRERNESIVYTTSECLLLEPKKFLRRHTQIITRKIH